jgi:ferredoxin
VSGASTGPEVRIDRDRCIGSGNCAYWLPAVFALDDEDIAHVVDAGAAPPDRIVEIGRQCPASAIWVSSPPV